MRYERSYCLLNINIAKKMMPRGFNSTPGETSLNEVDNIKSRIDLIHLQQIHRNQLEIVKVNYAVSSVNVQNFPFPCISNNVYGKVAYSISNLNKFHSHTVLHQFRTFDQLSFCTCWNIHSSTHLRSSLPWSPVSYKGMKNDLWNRTD